MKTSLFSKRVATLVLIVCALVGFSASVSATSSVSSETVAEVTQKITRAQLSDLHTLRAVVRAFELDEAHETLLTQYLFGFAPNNASIVAFVKTDQFSFAVTTLRKAVERIAVPALSSHIASIEKHLNENGGKMPTNRMNRMMFPEEYKTPLMALGKVLQETFARLIPQSHVVAFKKFMKDHVLPAPPLSQWGSWFSSHKKTLGIAAIVVAAITATGYGIWQKYGDKIKAALIAAEEAQTPGTDKYRAIQTAAWFDRTASKFMAAPGRFYGWVTGLFGGKKQDVSTAPAPASVPQAPAQPQASATVPVQSDDKDKSRSESDASKKSLLEKAQVGFNSVLGATMASLTGTGKSATPLVSVTPLPASPAVSLKGDKPNASAPSMASVSATPPPAPVKPGGLGGMLSSARDAASTATNYLGKALGIGGSSTDSAPSVGPLASPVLRPSMMGRQGAA